MIIDEFVTYELLEEYFFLFYAAGWLLMLILIFLTKVLK